MWLKAKRVDLTLERDMIFPANQFKVIDGMKITYKDVGKGFPVFCLPPWPSSSSSYIPFMSAVSDYVRIIALDMPGWGGYSDRMKQAVTIENYTEMIEKFIQDFGFTDFGILGYSFGGVFTQKVLSRGVVKPRKAVFVSTLHSGTKLADQHMRDFKLYKMVQGIIPEFIIKPLIASVMLSYRKGSNYYIYNSTKLYKQLVDEDMRASVRTIFDTIFSLLKMDVFDATVHPTECILFYSDQDPKFIQDESEEMARFLGLEPIVLQETDHDHFAFDVNKSTDLILNFLLA